MTQFTTAQRRDNLLTLATYLSNLPADYQGFEMRDFFETIELRNRRDQDGILGRSLTDIMDDVQRVANKYAAENGGVARCGAVACAVGHGPSAGFLFLPEELGREDTFTPNWFAYSSRVFLSSDENVRGEPFDWMFGGNWHDCDNTPQGAAKRIRYYLAHGVPQEYREKSRRHLVALYQDS